MEGRRGKRGGATVDASPKTSTRSSPARKASPARKPSPTRRASPARKASPSRKSSPARKVSPAPKSRRSTSRPHSTTQRRSARNKNDNIEVLPEHDEPSTSANQVLKLRLSPLKLDQLQGVKDGKGGKLLNHSTDGDDEVAQLTAKYLATAADKLTNNFTPSASELSKRSYSRSISRSEVAADEEEWTNSDHSEHNQDLYANRITRSRSKPTSSYLQRETSVATEAVSDFGGKYVAIGVTTLFAALAVFLQFACNRVDCNFKLLRIEKLLQSSLYYSLEAGYIYIGFAWLIYILSIVPYIGHKKKLPSSVDVEYYFNGLASAAIVIAGIGIAEYWFKYPIIALIYKNYLQLSVVAIIYALCISVWCFWRAAYAPNSQWKSKNQPGRVLSEFFLGREINPRWFGIIDIKLVHLRLSLITTLIFNAIFLARNIKLAPLPVSGPNGTLSIIDLGLHIVQNAKYDTVAAVTALLTIIYVLDILIFEHHLLSSFELQCEGVGCHLLIRYALFPLWTSLLPKFTLQHKLTNFCTWTLLICSIVFLTGIILKRLSNELKYHYRAYPTSKRSTGN